MPPLYTPREICSNAGMPPVRKLWVTRPVMPIIAARPLWSSLSWDTHWRKRFDGAGGGGQGSVVVRRYWNNSRCLRRHPWTDLTDWQERASVVAKIAAHLARQNMTSVGCARARLADLNTSVCDQRTCWGILLCLMQKGNTLK